MVVLILANRCNINSEDKHEAIYTKLSQTEAVQTRLSSAIIEAKNAYYRSLLCSVKTVTIFSY